MSEKSVFVPTGVIRCPKANEWYWCGNCDALEQAVVDYQSEEYEIYEEVKVRVDDM